ncbi:hypothetical protein PATSB16_25500 [Pandoraea thiooxydans]|uniref:Uncharacterized protein n=1 Tax=Pandoraea thiooxydans TaxID=445709 RepID=A0A0G3EUX9_9BURK|nr:tetratricopeptide repeat protein [Pandoraea thiooxydans]AKJ68496.1 hypothetical protein ABW99_10020 [Pandoraea thiooxydans]APR95890.1 hypothetical protein PATSB16_25500 [Pandoraea thiooxydans]
MTFRFRFLPRPVLAVLTAVLIMSGAAQAQLLSPQQEAGAAIGKLVDSRQYQAALPRIDAYLKKYPRDAQMRFTRGRVLTELGQREQAIAAFTALTQDFPELPEPYNNLAALYAQEGHYEQARAALEMAIRTNPNFAVAYANLGDVYAKLATQAYARANQLAPSANVNAKIQALDHLLQSQTIAPVSAAPASAAPAVSGHTSP